MAFCQILNSVRLFENGCAITDTVCLHVPSWQEHCGVVYCGSEENPAESARQIRKTKMQALDGHNAVFMSNDTCYRQESKRQPLSHAKALELKGHDIFAVIRPDPESICSTLQQYNDL